MSDIHYKSYSFTISTKESEYINDRIHADRKLPTNERQYPGGQRSEYLRKLINEDMKKE